jgi:hypothetical protein
MYMKSALFWDVTQREVVIPCDVSGQPIDPIFKDQDAQEEVPLDP